MCHGVYVGFDAFALIIPLLFAIGMVVGQGSGGRKLGRGRVDQEVERHLLPRHTPQNPTTFSYIPAHFPTFPHIFRRIFRFEQNATVHDARVAVWERFIVLSLWRAGQSYKILHNPSPICVSRNPTALCRNPTFSCNSLKFGKTC